MGVSLPSKQAAFSGSKMQDSSGPGIGEEEADAGAGAMGSFLQHLTSPSLGDSLPQ